MNLTRESRLVRMQQKFILVILVTNLRFYGNKS